MNVWKTKDKVRTSMKTKYDRIGCAKSEWIRKAICVTPRIFPVRGHGPLRTVETAKFRGTKGDHSLLNSREWLQRKHCLERRGLDMDWTSNAQGSFVLIHVNILFGSVLN